AITPASGFVGVPGALIIGVAAGAGCFWGATGLKRLLRADDSLDVFGIHGIGGLLGALLTGLLADKDIGGVEGNLTTQAIGAFGTLIYSGVVSFIILAVINFSMGLRVEHEDEHLGLDLALHSEQIN